VARLKTTGRLVVVGEAPGPAGECGEFDRDAGVRLARLAGLDFEGLEQRARLVNVLEAYPGERWPTGIARSFARDVAAKLSSRRVLLLGQRVAYSFGLGSGRYPLLLWEEGELHHVTCKFAVFPYPSSRNRWYGEREHRELAGWFLRQAISIGAQAGLL